MAVTKPKPHDKRPITMTDFWDEDTPVNFVPQKDWSLHAKTQQEFNSGIKTLMSSQNKILFLLLGVQAMGAIASLATLLYVITHL